MVMNKSKKGAELTIGTIIIIVLGVAVLVFLIWGFGTGWSNLWGKINIFSGGSANIDTIKQSCALACTGQQFNEYCLKRVVKVDNNRANDKTLSCRDLETQAEPLKISVCSDITQQCPTPTNTGVITCEGTAVACNTITTSVSTECPKQKGCSVREAGTSITCEGTPLACNTFTSATDCVAQKGCNAKSA